MSQLTEISTPAPVNQAQALSQGALENLGAHFVQCMPAHRAIHRLRGIREALHQFLMPRIVSSIAGVGVSTFAVFYFVS